MQLQEFYRQVIGLTDPELVGQCCARTAVHTLKKGEVLIDQGQTLTHVYFVLKGVLRSYAVDKSGHEITDSFAWQPGDAAVPNWELRAPATQNVEALTACELAAIPVELAEELLRTSPEVVRFCVQVLVKACDRHRAIKAVLYRYSSMERYRWFLREYPGLIDQISGRCVASFLGITPVTLSRLRSTLRRQQAADRAAAE